MQKFKVFLSGNKSQLSNYVKALNAQKISAVFDEKVDCDGLVLSGGGDISPCLYNKLPQKVRSVSLERDCFEFYLIKKYLQKGKPILGICRGLQVINVYFGGTLNQHISGQIHYSKSFDHDKKHINKSINGTFCRKLFGKYFLSNSCHHQCVEDLSDHLTPSAYSVDGVLEALEGKNILAVQFHPERMDQALGGKVFSLFSQML